MINTRRNILNKLKQRRSSIEINGILSGFVYECFRLSDYASENKISKMTLIRACQNPLTYNPLDAETIFKVNIMTTFLGFRKTVILTLLNQYKVEDYSKNKKNLYVVKV